MLVFLLVVLLRGDVSRSVGRSRSARDLRDSARSRGVARNSGPCAGVDVRRRQRGRRSLALRREVGARCDLACLRSPPICYQVTHDERPETSVEIAFFFSGQLSLSCLPDFFFPKEDFSFPSAFITVRQSGRVRGTEAHASKASKAPPVRRCRCPGASRDDDDDDDEGAAFDPAPLTHFSSVLLGLRTATTNTTTTTTGKGARGGCFEGRARYFWTPPSRRAW